MTDQAQQLRQRAVGREPAADLPAFAVTGGKGGVGKTCLAVNLGVLLARMGLKPLLVDCDLGLANADVMLGFNPSTTLFEVVTGSAGAEKAILTHKSGLCLLPAASGRDELTRLDPALRRRFIAELTRLAGIHDLLIFDTAAGIQREVIDVLVMSRLVLVVVTPEPTSLTDAYALIKVLEKESPGKDVRVLVNQAHSADEALATYNRLRQVARTYLKRDLEYLGQVPADRHVRDSIRARQPFATLDDSPATQALKAAALRLKRERWKADANGTG